ncbi:MAG TPA: hypothetical protein VGM64_04850 [Lacunisphaera sp.]|jgi:hypothetical protein
MSYSKLAGLRRIMSDDDWVKFVESTIRKFASRHSIAYAKTERLISAAFEVGCFHSLVEYYDQYADIIPKGLKDGKFKYLTSPNGNPANFSYVEIKDGNDVYQLRQQVRVRSGVNTDIAFTPDMAVFRIDRKVRELKDPDYAKGKRTFFFVEAEDLVSFHECKSMNPFPELLVSFLGMVFAAFPWAREKDFGGYIQKSLLHIAPTLFVGGSARGLHLRMIKALRDSFPVNVIVGMHYGTWELKKDEHLNTIRSRAVRSES